MGRRIDVLKICFYLRISTVIVSGNKNSMIDEQFNNGIVEMGKKKRCEAKGREDLG